MSIINYKDFVVGYKSTFTRTITKNDNELFAEISGDHNPLHFNDQLAQKVGFNAMISNGLITESRIGATLVDAFTSDDCLVVELEKNTRFYKPVLMGDDITTTVEVIGRIDAMKALKLSSQCFNQNNEMVVEATLVVKILSIK
jgi:3-hydroxybutyryl-CoA dehydratase